MKIYKRVSSRTSFLVASVVSIFSIGILWFAFIKTEDNLKFQWEQELDHSISKLESLLMAEVNGYYHGLEGLGGFYTAMKYYPSQDQISQYTIYRKKYENFPGALGIGFIRYVKKENLSTYLSIAQKRVPFFNFRRLPNAQENPNNYYIIESIEPLEKNKPALGLDIGSEQMRREAATEAMESGQPVLSRQIQLVQANKVEPGFLLLYPVYSTGQIPSTIEERRKKIIGWSYAPLLASKIYGAIEPKIDQNISVKISEIYQNQPEKLLVNFEDVEDINHNNSFLSKEKSLNIFGRQWKVTSKYKPASDSLLRGSYLKIFFLLCSIVFTVIVFYLRSIFDLNNKTIEQEHFFLKSIFQQSSDGVFVFNLASNMFTSCNNSAVKMFGFQYQEEVLNKDIASLFNNNDPSWLISLRDEDFWLNNLEDGQTLRYEIEAHKKNGQKFPVEVSLNGFFLHKEKVLLVVCRDLKELKQAEKKLNSTLRLHKAVLDGAEYSIISTTKEGLITSFNSAASRMLGYSPDEVIGKQTPAIIHLAKEVEEHSKVISAELNQVIEPGFKTFVAKAEAYGSETKEWTYVRKDGSRFPVRLCVTPIHDGENQLIGFLGVGQDLSKLKTAESDFAQLKGALEKGVILGVTGLSGEFIEVNENFSLISGYSKEELKGKSHNLLNSGVHSKDFFKNLWETIKSGRVWTGEIQNKRKNGEFYWVNTIIAPLFNEKQEIDRFYSISLDITEKKKTELSLLHSAKMASLGEMASGIAHEINNPLAIIQGKSSQLQRLLGSEKFNQQTALSYVDRIQSTCERIAKIIKGLKTFSRNSENSGFHMISVKKIVEDTLELCLERFKTYEIALEVNCNTDEEIECRAEQISQVVMNLLSNGFDAVEKLPNRWVRLDVNSKIISGVAEIEFVVTDSGQGIDSEVVNKMMQPFFTTKEVGRGTGLGLSISKGIAESHHGSLTYDHTSPNTRFTLKLPVLQVEKNKSAA